MFVPLSDATVKRKIDLLMSVFKTQHDKRWFTPETFLGLMRLRGIECNAPSGYAEAFYSRKLVLGNGLMNFDSSNALRKRVHRLIPGGAHTYAKGDDQYPEGMAPIIVRGQGCRVWDVDGNEFIEYGSGLRAVTLGHAYPPVIEAARRQLELGSNFVRPATDRTRVRRGVSRIRA